MQKIVNNEQTNNKDLYFETNFWSGKITMIYDGVPLKKVKRRLYEYRKDNVVEKFEVSGSDFLGITVKMFGKQVEILRKLAWYETVLALLVFISCIWFGMIGGAIGGALGYTNLIIIRNIEKTYLKVIISILFMLVAVLFSYIICILVLKGFRIAGIL